MDYIMLPKIEELCEQVYVWPELPTIELEKKKVRYRITDIRLLNKSALLVLEDIIAFIAENRDAEELEFDRGVTDNETLAIIRDIVMGIKFSVRKKGRNGFLADGAFLVLSMWMDGETITFRWAKDRANVIHDFIRRKQDEGKAVNYYELIMHVADKSIEEMRAHIGAQRD